MAAASGAGTGASGGNEPSPDQRSVPTHNPSVGRSSKCRSFDAPLEPAAAHAGAVAEALLELAAAHTGAVVGAGASASTARASGVQAALVSAASAGASSLVAHASLNRHSVPRAWRTSSSSAHADIALFMFRAGLVSGTSSFK